MALTAKLKNSYRKTGDSTLRFVYIVSGTPDDIKKYEEIRGEQLRLDDNTGKPLYFTKRYVADNIKLIITSENNIVTDDSDVAKLQSLIDQYGFDVARLLMAQSNGSKSEE